MKIAVVVPGGVDPSGTHRVVPVLLWLIERLAVSDEVHVFTLGDDPGLEQWPLLGALVHSAGARPRRLRALRRMLAEHRKGRFDVVHALWAGGPGVVAALFRRLTRVPVVLTLPGGDLAAIPEIGYGARLTMRGRFWVRLALRGATRIVAPSRRTQAAAAELGHASVVIPFGIPLDRWPPRAPVRRAGEGRLHLLHVANLNRVKDQETLLLALRILKESGMAFHLDQIGFDALGGAIQQRSRALGLEQQVAFHGFLPHAQLRQWVKKAQLMVVSSRHETGPMVASEAAIVGVPTVGTAVGQIADWAPDAALAVPVGDSAALAAAIARLAGDEDERLRLARRAQTWAIAHDADAYASAMRILYAELR